MSIVLPPGTQLANRSTDAPLIDAPDAALFPVRRFSVEEYERLGDAGILTEDDSVELLEGLIVEKMTKNPRHDATIDALMQLLARLLPEGWFPRAQNVLVTSDSAPEPDVVVVRGAPQNYGTRHPRPEDVALVIEVAETSLNRDRRKRRIYARAGINHYWIFDLTSDQIEMHFEPDRARGEYNQKQTVKMAAPTVLRLPREVAITLPLDTTLQFS